MPKLRQEKYNFIRFRNKRSLEFQLHLFLLMNLPPPPPNTNQNAKNNKKLNIINSNLFGKS